MIHARWTLTAVAVALLLAAPLVLLIGATAIPATGLILLAGSWLDCPDDER